ncbi:hypothetical protein V6R21_12905 [Limibacter armeniacum]|uniref:hypothetical protein n=1 Tax=Limibacter armeniacum TaxID=466084 RepID=UPI002FE60D89
MSKLKYFFVLYMAALFSLSACEERGEIDFANRSYIETQLFDKINANRTASGLPELKHDLLIFQQAKRYLVRCTEGDALYNTVLFRSNAENDDLAAPYFNTIKTNFGTTVRTVRGCYAFNDNLDPAGTAFSQFMEGGCNYINYPDFNYMSAAAVQNDRGLFYFMLVFVDAN